ncbi:MAG: HlyD family efflux transporter periplasmic adaptor subunit [Faecousia sp.]|nr:HlyD family efflux transporter periplasmic adaptor subunit [Bacillota bacterium]
MRKQGEFYLKLISILLAVVIAAYVLFSVILNSGSSYALETAVYCEVGDGVTVSGFVVRSEEVLVSNAPIVVCELTEGERVGGGQRVATGYQSGSARENREELNSLKKQRDQLAYAAEGSDSSNAAALDGEISGMIVNLAVQTSQQRFSAARATASELEPLVLRRSVSGDDSALIRQRISDIDQRISVLSAQTSTGATAITVAESGYFSEQTDGLERILTPERVETMSLSELRALEEGEYSAPDHAIGRLIQGQKWYFIAEIPQARAEQCEEGDRLTVNFADGALQGLRMRVERIGAAEDGSCVIVLSCEKMLQNVTALRRQTVDIVFDTYEGLRVPKAAIYYVNGETGVYILESARADWKKVEILFEYGNDYLVRWDDSDTDNLWPKDEIILTAEDISDGKVME